MNTKTIFSAVALVLTLSSVVNAEEVCPVISDNGSEVSMTVSNGDLAVTVKFGYGTESVSNSIIAQSGSLSSSAIINLTPQSFFADFATVPVLCDPESGECQSTEASIDIRRYRISSDDALVRFPVGGSYVTAAIKFSPTPSVTCLSDAAFNLDAWIAGLDFTEAAEVYASTIDSNCTANDIACPQITPFSILYSDNNAGEESSQRGGFASLDRAKSFAKRALRTSGVDNRKKLIRNAVIELNSFVLTAKFRSTSNSFKKSIRSAINLANRASKPSAGPKMVRAALLAIKGR